MAILISLSGTALHPSTRMNHTKRDAAITPSRTTAQPHNSTGRSRYRMKTKGSPRFPITVTEQSIRRTNGRRRRKSPAATDASSAPPAARSTSHMRIPAAAARFISRSSAAPLMLILTYPQRYFHKLIATSELSLLYRHILYLLYCRKCTVCPPTARLYKAPRPSRSEARPR